MEEHINAVKDIAHRIILAACGLRVHEARDEQLNALSRLAGDLLEHAEAIERESRLTTRGARPCFLAPAHGD
jgi:hypothetical protein